MPGRVVRVCKNAALSKRGAGVSEFTVWAWMRIGYSFYGFSGFAVSGGFLVCFRKEPVNMGKNISKHHFSQPLGLYVVTASMVRVNQYAAIGQGMPGIMPERGETGFQLIGF